MMAGYQRESLTRVTIDSAQNIMKNKPYFLTVCIQD